MNTVFLYTKEWNLKCNEKTATTDIKNKRNEWIITINYLHFETKKQANESKSWNKKILYVLYTKVWNSKCMVSRTHTHATRKKWNETNSDTLSRSHICKMNLKKMIQEETVEQSNDAKRKPTIIQRCKKQTNERTIAKKMNLKRTAQHTINAEVQLLQFEFLFFLIF